MPTRMLGDGILPESVQSTRQSVRSQLTNLREPIRSRREQLVPGPDVIGSLENRLMSLRSRFVSRDGALSRIRGRQQQGLRQALPGQMGGTSGQQQGGNQGDTSQQGSSGSGSGSGSSSSQNNTERVNV